MPLLITLVVVEITARGRAGLPRMFIWHSPRKFMQLLILLSLILYSLASQHHHKAIIDNLAILKMGPSSSPLRLSQYPELEELQQESSNKAITFHTAKQPAQSIAVSEYFNVKGARLPSFIYAHKKGTSYGAGQDLMRAADRGVQKQAKLVAEFENDGWLIKIARPVYGSSLYN